MARKKKALSPAMDALVKRLGVEIRRRRKAKGLKQDGLAGLSRAQMSIIENGRRSYGVDDLFAVLAALMPEPEVSIFKLAASLNAVDKEEAQAFGDLAAALHNPESRETAIRLTAGFQRHASASGDKDK